MRGMTAPRSSRRPRSGNRRPGLKRETRGTRGPQVLLRRRRPHAEGERRSGLHPGMGRRYMEIPSARSNVSPKPTRRDTRPVRAGTPKVRSVADWLLNDCQAATVEAAKTWPPERRTACIALLEDAVRRIEEAIAVREGALADPDESGVAFTAVVHIGAERARDLQRLYFDQKAPRRSSPGRPESSGATRSKWTSPSRSCSPTSSSAPRSRSTIGRSARSRRCAGGRTPGGDHCGALTRCQTMDEVPLVDDLAALAGRPERRRLPIVLLVSRSDCSTACCSRRGAEPDDEEPEYDDQGPHRRADARRDGAPARFDRE